MGRVRCGVLVVLTIALGACRPATPVAQTPQAPSGRTQIILLGTGNPVPDPERSGPAVAVVVDDVAYLFDCGPGVVRRASAAAARFELPALEPTHLAHLFVTHLHSDHTLGYADLIFTPWVVGRRVALDVYGPPGIAAMTEHLVAAYAEDVAVRTAGLEHGDRASAVPTVHEVAAGIVYQDDRVRVTAVPVHHGTWAHAFGYRIDTPDRTIVITGDYAPPFDSVENACDGCDVLVSEGYPTQILTRERQRAEYMRTFHTSAVELGELATRARAKHVVVTHRRPGVPDAVILDEIRRGYRGTVTLARDLDRL